MDIKFEKTSDARGLIEVKVTEADYAAKVDSKLKEIGKTHVIPGFRKGKITLPELRKRFGRSVKSDVINEEVFDAVVKYVRDNNIRILGYPVPCDVKEIDTKATDYTFNFECALWPELNIVLDKSVTLPYYNIKVTDEMIDENDKQMRERFGTQGPAEVSDDRAIIKGAIQELNPDGTIKTDEDAIQVVNGIVGPFIFKDKEQAELFVNKHVGDKVVFNPSKAFDGDIKQIASTLEISDERAAEVKGDFEMAIAEIIVSKPAELGQDYYDDVFGPDKVHNEEEYRKFISNSIAASLAPNSLQLFTRDAHDYLVNKYGDMKFDEDVLKRWLVASNKDADEKEIDKDFPNMLPQFKWEIISSDVNALLGVKVDEEDIKQRANFIARQQLQQYGMYNADDDTVAGFAERLLSDRELRRRITDDVEEIKMFVAIRDAVTLDEKSVTIEEFQKIANPGSDETEEAAAE